MLILGLRYPPLKAQHQHFKPIPIDFYSRMVGHFEALCGLVEQGELTSDEMEQYRLNKIRENQAISHQQFVDTIKAYLTADQTYPDCFRRAHLEDQGV